MADDPATDTVFARCYIAAGAEPLCDYWQCSDPDDLHLQHVAPAGA